MFSPLLLFPAARDRAKTRLSLALVLCCILFPHFLSLCNTCTTTEYPSLSLFFSSVPFFKRKKPNKDHVPERFRGGASTRRGDNSLKFRAMNSDDCSSGRKTFCGFSFFSISNKNVCSLENSPHPVARQTKKERGEYSAALQAIYPFAFFPSRAFPKRCSSFNHTFLPFTFATFRLPLPNTTPPGNQAYWLGQDSPSGKETSFCPSGVFHFCPPGLTPFLFFLSLALNTKIEVWAVLYSKLLCGFA